MQERTSQTGIDANRSLKESPTLLLSFHQNSSNESNGAPESKHFYLLGMEHEVQLESTLGREVKARTHTHNEYADQIKCSSTTIFPLSAAPGYNSDLSVSKFE